MLALIHAVYKPALIFFLLVSAFLQTAVAIAANESIPANRKVTSLKVYQDDVLVYIAPAFSNSQNCTGASGVTLQLRLSQDLNKTMFNSIIAAAKTGSPIGFGIGGCNGGYPRIYRVDTPF